MSEPQSNDESPVAIVDVQYGERGALAACAVLARWTDAVPCEEQVALVASVQPYRPGAFFERELPCLLSVLSKVQSPYRTVVVDGYVILDAQGAPGLGAHLYASFGGNRPVVGVAKTAFRGSSFAAPVLRGASRRPLFVTAMGMPVDVAVSRIRSMHGDDRIPTVLRAVDHLARGLRVPSG